MNLHPFAQALVSMRFDNCFNPYRDNCAVYDKPDAHRQRACTLSKMIERASSLEIDALWIGRDLGYRGGRRTGMALTDDVNMSRHSKRWNMQVDRPTNGVEVSERTAAVIWDLLDQIDAHVFLWNVFPLHPHEIADPFSNRQHNSRERASGEALLEALVTLLRPRRIVAIGNNAAASAQRVAHGIPAIHVRHPSYGGQSQFVRQISELYALSGRQRSLV